MAKKIGAIVSLSIIGILILTTIIMANVDVNHAINCVNPDKIIIQYSSKTRLLEDEDYKDVIDMINNASKESSLTALFNGTLNDKPEIVTNSSSGTSIPSTSNFYVTFVYNNPQKLMNGKKTFKDENGKDYYYYALTFSVSNADAIDETKVYVSPYYGTDGETVKNDFTTYTKYYKVTANYYNLYNYLVNNNYNK